MAGFIGIVLVVQPWRMGATVTQWVQNYSVPDSVIPHHTQEESCKLECHSGETLLYGDSIILIKNLGIWAIGS